MACNDIKTDINLSINAKEICLHFSRILPNQSHLTLPVHSIFSHAVNLQAEFGLCTLLCNTSLRPYSVVLHGVCDFNEWNLNKETKFFLNDNKIWSDSTPHISLKNTPMVNLKMDLSQNKRFSGDITEKLKTIAQAVYRGGQHQGLEPLLSCSDFPIEENRFSSFLRPRIAEFCSAMRQDDLEQIRLCTSRIAGCGTGLTPSADDFICGFLSVWPVCEAAPELAELKIKTAANEAAIHTSFVSASFLKYCAEGLYSLDMIEFVKILLEETDTRVLLKACNKVIQFGAASGTDFLCGVYCALFCQK